MRLMIIVLSVTALLHAQLDTAALSDNTWVNLWNLSDPLSVTGNNWAYENDFHAHPFYGFFIMGPGHVVHPQDCYWYPFDPLKKKWTKINSPRRPPRMCLSSFAVSSQDTVILQMGGFEGSHQQSQGRFDASYLSMDVGGDRGAQMWAYSFNRNEWYPMKGPGTLPPLNATQLPQYDPVHDIVISTQGSSTWIYNFHTNTATSLSSPASFAQYFYSAAVDTRRGLYYVLFSGSLYCFNPETAQWSTVPGTQPPTPSTGAGSNGIGLNMMAYDQVNDVMVYIGDDTDGAPSLKTWVFKCDSLRWSQANPASAPQDRGRLAYNRALNAFMLLGGTAPSGISRGGGTQGVWAYRYKRGPGVFAGMAKAPRAFINTTGSQPVLSWNAVAGASGYNVYRSTINVWARSFTKITSSAITDTFYTDAAAAPGTAYAYKVRAVSGSVEGEWSRLLYTRPGRVLNAVASVEDSSTVRVSWDANPAAEVTGYDVYRARGAAIYAGTFPSGYTKVNTSPVTGTEYVDAGGMSPSDKVARGYVVIARNGLGNTSGVSNECTTFPESPEWAWAFPQSTPQGIQMALRWQPPRRTKILGVNLWRMRPDNEAADPAKRNAQCGAGDFFWPTYTLATLQNGTLAAPALITDTLSFWPMPPSPVIPPATDITGYYLQGTTYIVRAVNVLGQEGFGTDQISPSNSEYGFGMVPASLRFNYSEWLPPLETEQGLSRSRVPGPELAVRPNPFRGSIHIAVTGAGARQVRIFDIQGRAVADLTAPLSSAGAVRWQAGRLPNGIYMVRLKAGEKILTRKILLQK